MLKPYKCAQCGSMNAKLYEDPRNPPIDVDDCLCPVCLDVATEERVEELEEEIDELKVVNRLAANENR